MDLGPKELQTMGIISVFKQAFKIIFSMKKIFTQITLAFIFPMSLAILCQMHIMESLFSNIHSNHMVLYNTPSSETTISKALSHCLDYQYIVLLLVIVLYLLCIFFLSHLSSSAVTYTVGCIYIGADLKFTEVVHAVQTICKKFLIKKAWHVLLHHYMPFYILYSYLMHVFVFTSTWGHRVALFCVATSFTTSIFTPINHFEWHLAGVFSTFQDVSITRTEDKHITARYEYDFTILIAVMLNLITLVTEAAYYLVIVHGNYLGQVHQAISGSICYLFISQAILVGLVVQTTAYFLFKASNGESIEETGLSDTLQEYVQKEKNVPLKDSSVV